MVPEVDVVYPLHGDSAIGGESTSGYPVGETPINRPSERHPESDGGGISSVVRIRGTVVALARRVRGRSLRVLIDSGSTSNYLSAQCQTTLELRVKLEEEFERLMLVDGSEVCMHKGMSSLSFIVGIIKPEFSPGFSQIFMRS